MTYWQALNAFGLFFIRVISDLPTEVFFSPIRSKNGTLFFVFCVFSKAHFFTSLVKPLSFSFVPFVRAFLLNRGVCTVKDSSDFTLTISKRNVGFDIISHNVMGHFTVKIKFLCIALCSVNFWFLKLDSVCTDMSCTNKNKRRNDQI